MQRRRLSWAVALAAALALASLPPLVCAASVEPDPKAGPASFVRKRSGFAPGRIIVKLKRPSKDVVASAAASAALPGLKFLQPLAMGAGVGGKRGSARRRLMQAVSSGSVAAVYRITDNTKVPAKVQQLQALPMVDWASPDVLLYPAVLPPGSPEAAAEAAASQAFFSAAAAAAAAAGSGRGLDGKQQVEGRSGRQLRAGSGQVVPNDPKFKDQWHHPVIDSTHAWAISTGAGSQAKLCIIDTGMQRGHPDLTPPVVGWNTAWAVYPDSGGEERMAREGDPDFHAWDDVSYHGTHVSGLATARGNNSVGVAGLAYQAPFMMCRVFKDPDTASLSSVARCVDLCINAGAKVVSMSLEGDFSNFYIDIVQQIQAAGALLVAAAGNSQLDFYSWSENTWAFPAGLAGGSYGFDNVIAVASIAPNGALSSFSNYGSNVVSLAAPGSYILSTFPTNVYSILDGTSMATPLVSAAATMLFSAGQAALGRPVTYLQVKAALLGGVDPFTDAASLVASGGRLNAARSLRLLTANQRGAPPPSPPLQLVPGTLVRSPGQRWMHFVDSAPFFVGLASPEYSDCIQACMQDMRCGRYVYFRPPSSTTKDSVVVHCLLWSPTAILSEIRNQTNVESGLVLRIQPPPPKPRPPPSPKPPPPPSPRPPPPPSPRPPPPPSPRPPPPPSPRPPPPLSPRPPPPAVTRAKPAPPPPPAPNVRVVNRLLGAVWQSSTLSAHNVAARARDGNFSTFSSTKAQHWPYFAMDLRKQRIVTAVEVRLRRDALYRLVSLHDLEVRVGNTPPSGNALIASSAANPHRINSRCIFRGGQLGRARGQKIRLQCVRPHLGRYVTLQIRSAAGKLDVLSMAEVAFEAVY